MHVLQESLVWNVVPLSKTNMYNFHLASELYDHQFLDSLQVIHRHHGRPQGQKHRQGPADQHEAHRRHQRRRWLGYLL